MIKLHFNFGPECGKLSWQVSGFGVLNVAGSPFVTIFAGSHPAESVGFLGRNIYQQAFLRRGSKDVGPMS